MNKLKRLLSFIAAVLVAGTAFVTASAETSVLSVGMKYYDGTAWRDFKNNVAQANKITAIRLTTPGNAGYYFEYQTWNEGRNGYYSSVKSNDTASSAYAGTGDKETTQRAVQLVKISVYDSGENKLDKGIVVMYRAKTDRWLPWVSNAAPEYMQSVKYRYGFAGSLDTEDGSAGKNGANITAIEIRVFKEDELMTSCGNKNIKAITAPYINQSAKYPTGCESVSTVMALKYAGVDISVDDFIDNYLDKSSDANNFDPNKTFGGDPRRTDGMGCYAPVIMNSLERILKNKNYSAQNLTGTPLSKLCTDYINKNIPVIIWATRDMKEAYITKHGNVNWTAPEHCLLLTGYDDKCYIFNDPLQKQNIHYLKSDVEEAYTALGKQAISVNRTLPSAPVLETKTADTIVLKTDAEYEYKMDDGAWQDSGEFKNLIPGNTYKFYRRLKATDTEDAGEQSAALTVATDKLTADAPAAPALASKTHNTVTLNAVSGCEYKRDGGAWQKSPVFTGLNGFTEYTFYQRLAETATHNASTQSAPLKVKTDKTPVPDAVTSSKYSVNGGNIGKIPAGTSASSLLSGLSGGNYCNVYKGNTAVSGNTPIGTGMTVKIMDGNTVKAAYTVVVTGDTNGDGVISVTDMLSVKAYLLKKGSLNGVYATAADTSGDNTISITDFIQIKAKILGKGSIIAR